jgi:hypothetical protein
MRWRPIWVVGRSLVEGLQLVDVGMRTVTPMPSIADRLMAPVGWCVPGAVCGAGEDQGSAGHQPIRGRSSAPLWTTRRSSWASRFAVRGVTPAPPRARRMRSKRAGRLVEARVGGPRPSSGMQPLGPRSGGNRTSLSEPPRSVRHDQQPWSAVAPARPPVPRAEGAAADVTGNSARPTGSEQCRCPSMPDAAPAKATAFTACSSAGERLLQVQRVDQRARRSYSSRSCS